MPKISVKADCLFCEKFYNDQDRMLDPIFDKILWQNKDFVIVPAKGALVEGYLLVITKRHYSSLANLPSHILSDLTKIKFFIRYIMIKYFKSPIFFEHGPVCRTDQIGSCIDHAHLHCVPFDNDIVPKLFKSHQLVEISKLEALRNYAAKNQSYLFFENQKEKMFIFFDVSVPSQYFRKLIAKELGIPYEWDWNAFPFEEKARSTLKVLKTVQFDII